MSKILFNGYYGYSNTGDSSFMEVSAWGARNIWKQEDIFFQTPDSKNLPKLITKANFYRNWHIKGTYKLQQIYQLNTSKYFISSGGSIFYKQLQTDDIKSIILQTKKNKRVKIGAIGVSIGPFQNAKEEKAIKEYLNGIDFLAVRDNRSFEICKSFDLPYKTINAADLSALLPQIYLRDQSNYDRDRGIIKTIAVSYCKYESYHNLDKDNEKSRFSKIASLLNDLLKNENNHLKFIIFNGHSEYGDYTPTLELIAALFPIHPKQVEIINFDQKVKYLWTAIRKCDLLISTRLHAAAFACFGGIPFFLIEYHQKCSDFLDDIGQATKYRVFDSDFNQKEIVGYIEQILYLNSYIPPKKIEEIKNRALLNFEATKEHFNEL